MIRRSNDDCQRLFALALRLVRNVESAESIVRELCGLAPGTARSREPGADSRREVVRRASRLLQDRRSGESHVRAAELRRYMADIQRLLPGSDLEVEGAVAALPDRTRCILVLRDIEGYTASEIRTLLGVSEKTVRQRIREARRLVRYQLAR